MVNIFSTKEIEPQVNQPSPLDPEEFLTSFMQTSQDYTARNLSGRQVQQESGGKQFDPKTGKPLTSSAGAVGVAQVMESTGPEAAKLAGVPWDRNRWLNDRDYNLQIGDAYQGMLDKKFGKGSVAALAAYNAGPNRVEKLIQQHGDNWLAHAPAETQDYVAKIRGGAPTAKSSGTAGTPFTYDPGTMTQGEQNNMASGDKTPNLNPFALAAEVDSRAGTVDQAGDVAADFFGAMTDTLMANRTQRMELAGKAVETKKAINAEIQQETQAIIEKAKPLFQSREAIAARKVQISQMNPLERAIRGVVSPDFSGESLNAREAALDNQLMVLGTDHERLTKWQTQLSSLVENDYNLSTTLLNMSDQNATEDFKLATQGYALTQQLMGDTLQKITGQTTILRAQEVAKSSLLGGMTDAQIEQGFTGASNSPDGTFAINGVTLTKGELQQARLGRVEQQLSLRSRANALEMQDMQLADALEEKIIENMGVEDLKAAAAAGGVWQGQQLNLPRLTQALAAAEGIQGYKVQQIEMQTAPGMAAQMFKSLGAGFQGGAARLQGMFGQIPQEFTRNAHAAATEMNLMEKEIKAAVAQGVGKEYLAKNLPRIQALYKQQQDTIGVIMKRWSGGNKDLEAVGMAWATGQPIAGESAVKGMIQMARGGMPSGTRLSGAAAVAFNEVKKAVDEFDRGGAANESTMAMLTAPQKAQKEIDLQRKVGALLRGNYEGQMSDSIIRSAPAIAKQVQVGGKPHPFNQVNPADFAHAVDFGDQEGIKRAADEYGVKPEVMQAILSQGEDGVAWQTYLKGNPNKGFPGGIVQALQTQATMQALDASPSAKPGFKPSAAWADLMNNGQFQRQVNQIVDGAKGSSFGDFLVTNAGGGSGSGGFMQNFQTYATGVRQARATLGAEQTRNAVREASGIFAGNPVQRAGMIISTMEDVTPSERKAILGYMESKGLGGQAMVGAGDFNMQVTTDFFKTTRKLEDPQLEAIRRKIGSKWDGSASMYVRMRDFFRGGN